MVTSETLNQLHLGDAVAFEKIYQHYFIHVFLIALRYCKDEDDAKDIRSQAFIRLWDNHNKYKFENAKALYGWLNKITSNICIDYLRNRNKRMHYEDIAALPVKFIKEDGHDIYVEEDYIFEATDKEAAILDRLYCAIENLPFKNKQVFKMRWLEDLKFIEISNLLKIELSTVKKRYARALILLRKLFLL